MDFQCEIRNSQLARSKARNRIKKGLANSSDSEDEDWMVKTADFGTPSQGASSTSTAPAGK